MKHLQSCESCRHYFDDDDRGPCNGCPVSCGASSLRRLLLSAALSILCAPAFAAPIDRATLAQVYAIGDGFGVPRSVTYSLAWEESRLRAKAKSPPTAEGFCSRGLVQLYTRPGNIAYLLANYWPGDPADFDIDNPLHNATVGLGYLAALHERFGNWYEALVFYNSGKLLKDASPEVKAYARRITRAPEVKL